MITLGLFSTLIILLISISFILLYNYLLEMEKRIIEAILDPDKIRQLTKQLKKGTDSLEQTIEDQSKPKG